MQIQLIDGHQLTESEVVICTNICWIGCGNIFCFESAERARSELQMCAACDDEPTGWVAR